MKTPSVHRVVLEVAVETLDDALAAYQGGADRLELCAALDLGGLTPSIGTLVQARQFAKTPICIMIRPRPGDFVYSPGEVEIMLHDLEQFRALEPAGFVFGALHADGRINLEACYKLITLAKGIPCTFHRAFDRTPNLAESLEEMIQLGFNHVLTSGRGNTAEEGIRELAILNEQAKDRIQVIACGRVRAENVARIVKFTHVPQVHGSFAMPIPERLGVGNRGYPVRSQTDREAVRAAREILDRPWELTIA